MKKCTSCAKDLPDSALHCVFCGAKQAPAPVPGAAAQQAKTVLGYQAGDVVKELQRQGVGVPRPGGHRPDAPASPSHGNPPIGTAPTMARPGPTPMQPPMQPMPGPPMPQAGPFPPPQNMQQMPQPPMAPQMHPQMPQPPGPPPSAASQAKTMFIPGGQGPGPLPMQSAPIQMPNASAPSAPAMMPHYPPPPPGVPMNQGYQPPSAPVPMNQGYQPPSAPMPMPGYPQPGAPVPMPMPNVPSAPAAAPPYLASQTALRASRPVEPFADGLKLVLLSFGILLLGAFATPTSTDPMSFHWNTIIDAPGMFKLMSLMIVTTGVLALVIALMPLAAVPRGAIAAGIGLFIVATPIIVAGDIGPWQDLVKIVAGITLVAGLLLRHEYREAQLGRLLTTIGAVAVLATYLIPVGGGDVPLVAMFQGIIDAPLAEMKILAIVMLLPAILAIVSLLVWLPAPSSAGAKTLAWIWIVYPAFLIVTTVLVKSGGDVAGVIKQSPFAALMAWVPGSASAAFLGYGVATVLGKQLE